MSETSLQEKLVSLVAESAATMQALGAARSLGLGSWCIGAEAVRNLVWDHLHGFEVATRPEDVDLVFYEAADLSQGLERNLESKLALAAPEFKWEVVNQAAFIDGSALNPEKGLSHSGHWLKASRRGQRSPNA